MHVGEFSISMSIKGGKVSDGLREPHVSKKITKRSMFFCGSEDHSHGFERAVWIVVRSRTVKADCRGRSPA